MKPTSTPSDLIVIVREPPFYKVVDVPSGRQVGKAYTNRRAAYRKEAELLDLYRKAGRLIDRD